MRISIDLTVGREEPSQLTAPQRTCTKSLRGLRDAEKHNGGKEVMRDGFPGRACTAPRRTCTRYVMARRSVDSAPESRWATSWYIIGHFVMSWQKTPMVVVGGPRMFQGSEIRAEGQYRDL